VVAEKKHKDGMYALRRDGEAEDSSLMYSSTLTFPPEKKLGFLDVPAGEKYILELATESHKRSEELFGAVLSTGARVAIDNFIPLGGILTSFVDSIMGVLMSPQKQSTSLDMTALFSKFEKRLNRLNFGHVLEEIQRTYAEFLQWMRELLDPDFAPTELKYKERKVFMMESHMDVARLLFKQKHEDKGLEAYYLFEPLLQQAMLHQQVMLMHVGLFQQLGDHKEAQVHVGRSKRRYNQYRQLLTDMQGRLIRWRADHIHHGDCSVKDWKKEPHGARVYTVAVTYKWDDSFNDVEDKKVYEIERYHGTMMYNEHPEKCTWSGTFHNGSQMRKEAYVYEEALKATLEQYTNNLLKLLDAPWLTLPGKECLEDFVPKSLGDLADYKCTPTSDTSVSQRLHDHFGALQQDGFWPGQQPVLSASQYLLCEAGASDHNPSDTNGKICAKFV
jgi:hypothetical protein